MKFLAGRTFVNVTGFGTAFPEHKLSSVVASLRVQSDRPKFKMEKGTVIKDCLLLYDNGLRVQSYHHRGGLTPMFTLRVHIKEIPVPKKIEKQYSTEEGAFKLDKVLLFNKLSRLEVEKITRPDLNRKELEKSIKSRGIDYDALVKNHNIHKDFQKIVENSFKEVGVTVRTANRFNYSESDIQWCDAIFPIGGDGTFLHAARHIPDRNKPLIGFNSDPTRSEGFLCLPKKYSSDVSSAIKKLIDGKFKWMFRTRIRVTFKGECSHQTPIELHDVTPVRCNVSNTVGNEKTASVSKSNEIKRRLPVLALNEVFMSEIFAAKVSYFEMRLNNSEKSVKIKSSGLCICTGTGSTSWNLSINRLSKQDVSDILRLYIHQTNGEISKDFENLAVKVSSIFNQRFKFGPEERILAYTIRDLISLRVWPNPKGVIEPRGFAEKIEVRSKCLDAGIIVDGSISLPFNEGTVTVLETHPEDALRTVLLDD